MKTTAKALLAALAAAGLSGSAMAADLYVAPSAPEAVAPAATDWDGPYVGAHVGYGWGTLSSDVASTNTAGWFVGGQVGYNFHLSGNIVTGLEGDIAWSDETGTLGVDAYRVNWEGSVRGRLGVDLDGILPYAEAGVAFANATLGPDSATHTGWTAGAGVEFKLADQVSANVEYRYSDYGKAAYGGTDHSLTDNSVRLGVNYHF